MVLSVGRFTVESMSESVVDRPAVLEWFARDVGRPAASPAKLASLVDAALDRSERVLFTVTPREDLDVSARWQRLADQGWCGLLRHVVACTARLSGTDRDFAGDELALALGVAPLTGRALVWEFGAFVSLPGLVEAAETGRLSVRASQSVHARPRRGVTDTWSSARPSP